MAELKARTMERMAGLEARMTAQLVDAGAAAEPAEFDGSRGPNCGPGPSSPGEGHE